MCQAIESLLFAACRRQSEAHALDMTVNTLLAFDSVNGMFRGPLQQDFGWQLNEPTATVRVQEPTLSTRAALDAVGGMFDSNLHQGDLAGGKDRRGFRQEDKGYKCPQGGLSEGVPSQWATTDFALTGCRKGCCRFDKGWSVFASHAAA